MKKRVIVLAEAASDIERGIDFYNSIEIGIGLYFRDSIIQFLCGLIVMRRPHCDMPRVGPARMSIDHTDMIR